jgi:hypothetical protein
MENGRPRLGGHSTRTGKSIYINDLQFPPIRQRLRRIQHALQLVWVGRYGSKLVPVNQLGQRALLSPIRTMVSSPQHLCGYQENRRISIYGGPALQRSLVSVGLHWFWLATTSLDTLRRARPPRAPAG